MMPRTVPAKVLLPVFVLSGAAGLIYEVVWARQLVLVFGNTSQAVSTILTGFFGGLAVGGAIGGRIADRIRRPLLLYGLLEIALVAIVLVTPLSFGLIGQTYRGVYESLAGAPLALALVRFGLSILALAPATVLMGATLPTLTRYLTGRGDFAGAFTRLYSANTIGAIAGTALAGFVLIEVLGLHGALLVGALCSGTAGLVALALDRWLGPDGVITRPAAPRGALERRIDAAQPAPRRWRLALTLAFASGLTSLGYQVVWNRLIGAGTGSSTYVFTIILALFLTGIAAGAVLFALLRRRTTSIMTVIAVAQIATAALVLIGTAVALASPGSPFSGATPKFASALRHFAIGTAIVVLPPTVALGITFPATSALLGDESGREGASSGSLLAINTLGSIVATFVLPFFVIPLIGSSATLAGLAVINALLGVALALSARAPRPTFRVSIAALGALVAIVIAGTYVGGVVFRNPTTALIASHGGTVYQATEDEIASVVAGKVGARPQLWVAGTSMTVLTVDTKLMPLIPLMLRPDAHRALVIAFGMGTAFRTAVDAGLKTDVVELVPSVTGMFHWFYPDAGRVMADPRGRVIIADGRNHVELTNQTYDFVVVDPPPPIESSGVSVISSLEFYEAAKGRLAPRGVMVQWVPFGQTVDEFLAHVRTFEAVFPNVDVVAGPGSHGFFMIGSDGPVTLDPAAIRSVLSRPGVLQDLDAAPDSAGRTVDGWIQELQAMEWAHGETLRKAVGDGPLVTDDRPLPEYFLIRRLQDPSAPALSLQALRRLLPAPTP